MFLDGILKGLVLWIYGLILEGVEYMADSLLDIFSLDLAYFETYAPVVNDIQNIVIAVGWALLIVGRSRNTEDIFKEWSRMFGSMCVMMLMNVILLKLLLPTMSTVPSGLGIFPWLIFVTAIVRVGRKVDDIVC